MHTPNIMEFACELVNILTMGFKYYDLVYNCAMTNKYDYLIVGAGLFAGIAAHELTKKGYRVLVVEKRNHVAGNIYTEEVEGIQVHRYGPHFPHKQKGDLGLHQSIC